MSSRPDNHSFTETEKLLEKAKQKELNGELDSAFQLYIQVGQSFLQLSRTATSIKSKNLCKEYAGKALERAKKLKAAKGEALRPVRDDVYSQYSQGSVVEESSSWNGIHFPPWPETDLIMGTSSLAASIITSAKLAAGFISSTTIFIPSLNRSCTG
ncbi:hypothetical protein SISNIDRAFT_324866 [Sistotremastrum niveocremeum HHB9708]|uniref:MIT domain-containing protein n=1 Tax=Sistotremastrum niveocremeum HHB9708 TaxID=1314777 RepID=A0A164X8A3_9AGAM|nr:hypothetical protein SISNIDRAFT_324866 [Sistotremastrum niveocremeum HHB9708]